jgi:drug/metabolite transporter (DMT)-like permease
MLVLLSVPLLGQKLSTKGVIALLVSFAGIILIAGRAEGGRYFSNIAGDALAVGSSVIWALFWLLNVRDKRDATVKLWYGFLFGSLLVSLVLIISGKFSVEPQGILPALYVGLFEMGITFVFWLKAMQLTERTEKVSQLIFLSPFLSLFWIQMLLGERIMVGTIAGLVLIVAGILIQQGVSVKRK